MEGNLQRAQGGTFDAGEDTWRDARGRGWDGAGRGVARVLSVGRAGEESGKSDRLDQHYREHSWEGMDGEGGRSGETLGRRGWVEKRGYLYQRQEVARVGYTRGTDVQNYRRLSLISPGCELSPPRFLNDRKIPRFITVTPLVPLTLSFLQQGVYPPQQMS